MVSLYGEPVGGRRNGTGSERTLLASPNLDPSSTHHRPRPNNTEVRSGSGAAVPSLAAHSRSTFNCGRPSLSRIHREGRVEDGRGSWGPMAITPFPISAHRTGGPDFRSPALRLASPQGTRRGSEWQAFEAQQTEFPIDSVVREPAGAAPCHFVPSCEEVAHALVGIAVNTAEC